MIPSIQKFILEDFRIVTLNCERTIAPEDVKQEGGELHVSGASTAKFPPKPTADKLAVVRLDIVAIGKGQRNSAKSGNKAPTKLFSIKVSAEGRFKFSKKAKISEKDFTPEVALNLTGQIHPLVMMCVKAYAEQLGFLGVSPDLGFDPPAVKIQEEKPEKKSDKVVH